MSYIFLLLSGEQTANYGSQTGTGTGGGFWSGTLGLHVWCKILNIFYVGDSEYLFQRWGQL